MSVSGVSIPIFRPIEIPNLSRFFSQLWLSDIAMDLGTANTLLYIKGRGIVLNEPSLVALNEQSHEVVAIGQRAKEIYGKTGQRVKCIRPMKDGVIANFEMTRIMIRHMLSMVCHRFALRRPKIAIGIPSGITQVEKRAVIDAALSAGARQVLLVEESMAAALGAGLPVEQACGNMIVDIGGGTTEVAVISMQATAYSHSIRVAGDEMDEAIIRAVKRFFGIELGIFEAERVKLLIGSALKLERDRTVRAFGRDCVSGIPRQVDITDEVVREALHEPIEAIKTSIMTAIEQISPEFAHDILAQGIHLAGGGSLIKGLAERLHRETGLIFVRSQDPLSCVVRGVGMVIEDLKQYEGLCIA